MNTRIAVALGASMVLHAAALSWVGHKGLDAPGAMPSDMAARGKLIMGRLVPQVPAQAALVPEPAVASIPAELPPPAALVRPAAAASLPPASPAPDVVAVAPFATPAADRALAGFVPATQLSMRPVPIFVGELEPDWLKDIPEAAVVQLSVYVAADGSVAHVEVRKGSNARITEMARLAFAQARYKPGMVQGRNVAARVDVSLDYEAQRERVIDPNAPRPAANVLGKGDIKAAAPLAPDVPQSGQGLR
ncbi:MAG: energy transducer TonB [Pseudomonadota bacterium]